MFKTPIHDTWKFHNTNKIINDFLPKQKRRDSSRIIKSPKKLFGREKTKNGHVGAWKLRIRKAKDTENHELDMIWRFGRDSSWKLSKSSQDLIDNSHSISSKFNYVLWRTKHAKCRLHMHSHCRVIMIAFIARGNIDYNFSPARKIDLILSVSNSFIINERQFAICDCLSTWKIGSEDFSRNKKHENRLELHKNWAETSRVWWSCWTHCGRASVSFFASPLPFHRKLCSSIFFFMFKALNWILKAIKTSKHIKPSEFFQ